MKHNVFAAFSVFEPLPRRNNFQVFPHAVEQKIGPEAVICVHGACENLAARLTIR
jgi:hypothetical protein